MTAPTIAVDARRDALSDDELTSLALAADPDAPLAPDAVSIWSLEGDSAEARPDSGHDGLLPEWYMPITGAAGTHLEGWRRRMAWMLVIAFFAIDAVGMCTTFGPIFHG
jgi:hypothetical protein